MDKISFEQLPEAVQQLSQKLDYIQQLLLDRQLPATATPTDKLLTIDEAGKLLNLAKPTLYGLVCRHAIPVCKKGKRLYFSQQELLAWIESGRKDTRSDVAEQVDRLLAGKKGE